MKERRIDLPFILKKDDYYLMSTHKPGVFIRTSLKEGFFIPKKIVDSLSSIARRHQRLDERIKQDKKKQDSLKKQAIYLAQEKYPGLRGLESFDDNLVLTITPNLETDNPKIRQELGDKASTVLSGKIHFDISFPIGQLPNDKDIQDMTEVFIKALMEDRKITYEEARKLVEVDFELNLDRKTLKKMEEKGEISLSKETKRISKWNVGSRYLEIPPQK